MNPWLDSTWILFFFGYKLGFNEDSDILSSEQFHGSRAYHGSIEAMFSLLQQVAFNLVAASIFDVVSIYLGEPYG